MLPGLLLSLLVLCLSPPGGMSPSAPAVLLLAQGLGTDEVKLNLKQTQTLVWYQCKKNISNSCIVSTGWRQAQ